MAEGDAEAGEGEVEIDADIGAVGELPAAAGDAALVGEGRRDDGVGEAAVAQAGGDFDGDMAAQQAVELLEGEIGGAEFGRPPAHGWERIGGLAGGAVIGGAGRVGGGAPMDGDRAEARHETGGAVERAGEVVGEEAEGGHTT